MASRGISVSEAFRQWVNGVGGREMNDPKAGRMRLPRNDPAGNGASIGHSNRSNSSSTPVRRGPNPPMVTGPWRTREELQKEWDYNEIWMWRDFMPTACDLNKETRIQYSNYYYRRRYELMEAAKQFEGPGLVLVLAGSGTFTYPNPR